MSKKTDNMSLEEKIDLLIKYQKSARLWAFIRALISITLFVVFIVLPILWSIQFLREFMASAAFESAKSGFEQMGNLNLNEILRQLGQ